MIAKKECTRCGRSKPSTSEHFGRRTSSKDGLHYWCRECDKSYHRERRAAGLGGGRALAQQKKLWAMEQKGGQCADCSMRFDGRTECAEFDHIRGRTSVLPAHSKITDLGWKKLAAELENCDLVCANCHKTRTKNRHNNG